MQVNGARLWALLCLFLAATAGMSAAGEAAAAAEAKGAGEAGSQTCILCEGLGYREIGGEKVICPRCNGKGYTSSKDGTATDPARQGETGVKPDATPTSTSSSKASTAIPGFKKKKDKEKPAEGGETEPESAPATVLEKPAVNPLDSVPFKKRLPIISTEVRLATEVFYDGIWGKIMLASQDAFQSKVANGPGFTVKAPVDWNMANVHNAVHGGIDHVYSSPDGSMGVAVAVFSLPADADLEAKLTELGPKLFSNFKCKSASRANLNNRPGLAAFYEGIINGEDVGGSVFFTANKNKGYLIFTRYYDADGANYCARVVSTLRVF